MSSALISKSKTSASSKMRLRLADLGITTKPCCNAQRMRICAVDLPSGRREDLGMRGSCDQEAAGCTATFEYLLASATSFGSCSRIPLVKGL